MTIVRLHRGARPAPAAPQSIWPLSISGRHLQTATGQTFFVNGDTPWCLIQQLTDAEVTQYLNDRQARGFNSLICELIEPWYSTDAPNMITGEVPFTTPDDIRTPSDAYFDRAVSIIEETYARDMLIVMTPVYLGYQGNQEGWWSQISARTTGECETFGAYIGAKFARLPNIIWAMGGDYYAAATLSRTQALVTGLKSTDRADRLFTYHSNPGESSAEVVGGESWLDVVWTYEQEQQNIVTGLAADYGRATVRPFWLAESMYEQESTTTLQHLRAQAYWSILTGGMGAHFGNNPIWHFEGPHPLSAYTGTWESNLDSAGAQDRTRWKNFFTAFAWHQLVPDRDGSVLTSGAGTLADRAYAARMADGSKIIVYTPSQKALTIALSQIEGSGTTASWFNPATAETTAAGSFGVTGSQAFTPPSSGDWVLVLEAT